MRGSLGMVVALVVAAAATAAAQGIPVQWTAPQDLVYRGAFLAPSGDAWTWGGHALAFRADGDPGNADAFAGSLFLAGNAHQDLVGEITIPAPVVGALADLPRAAVLQPLTDVTGGLLAATCTACLSCDCAAWDVSGLEVLPGVGRLAWNIHDWYNAGAEDLGSLGWSGLDLAGAVGIWHIGPRPNDVEPRPFHNGKTSDYLLTVPAAFADTWLSGRSLIAGYHRESGTHGGSQGPTLYAVAPWAHGDPPDPDTDLAATALVYYPFVAACSDDNLHDQCHFPGYRVDDAWGGGAWVGGGGRWGILVFGLKGLGDNCYGTPGVATPDYPACPVPACSPYQGWHSDPYEPSVLFYAPDQVAEVAAGTRAPWEVLPYATRSLLGEVMDPACARLGGVAHDPAAHRVYVAEGEVGDSGETVIHVYEVRVPLFVDGFESAHTGSWSVVM